MRSVVSQTARFDYPVTASIIEATICQSEKKSTLFEVVVTVSCRHFSSDKECSVVRHRQICDGTNRN